MSTLTVYPEFGYTSASHSNDGYVGRLGVNETFATIVAGAGTGGTDSTGANAFCSLRSSAITNQYDQLRRLFLLFDTSALGSSATISAATLSLWGIGKDSGLGTCDLVIVSSNPTDTYWLVDADYSAVGSTSFGSVSWASFTATDSAYTDITLNASGLAAINPTGTTKFAGRLEWDRAGTFGGTWASGTGTFFQVNMVENASGTAKAPKLVVTYTAGSAALTGTGGDGMTEAEVVSGGQTIIITLTGTTWVP